MCAYVEIEVLFNSQIIPKYIKLWTNAHNFTNLIIIFLDIKPTQPRNTRRGLIQPRQNRNKRRFPGAVGTQETQDKTRFRSKRDVLDGQFRAQARPPVEDFTHVRHDDGGRWIEFALVDALLFGADVGVLVLQFDGVNLDLDR